MKFITALLLTGSVLMAGATATMPPAFVADLGSAMEGHVSFTLDSGSRLIGYATEGGGFALAVVPLDTPAPRAAATGLEPTYECTNDVRGGTDGTTYRLTPSFVGAVAPNLASLKACTGGTGLQGSVGYVEFRSSGDGGGGMRMWSADGHFFLWCSSSMTLVGAGAYDTWATTLLWDSTVCWIDWYGSPPSQWYSLEGDVTNAHRTYGAVHALVMIG